MKKFTLIAASFLVFVLSFYSSETKASHAAGGELVYQWKSDSTYTFYFKFYRDCSGSAEPFVVTLCFYNPCTNQSGGRTMTKLSTLPGGGSNGAQVSTGCANQKNKCDSSASPIPGYREWWYAVDYTLPARCSSWRFSVAVAVRNTSANLVGTPNFYVETILNNVAVTGNSSPVFSVKPVPYVCHNQFYNYNNGGVDPNGDSVAFEVINPLTRSETCNNSSPTNCTFQSASPALSIPTNPFQTNNTFVVNPTTGELGFTPTLQGSHTVSIRAKEYRNGTLIGSVMRDIQVQVIPCSTSSVTPTISNDSLSVTGAATYSGGVVTGCATQQFSFCFDIKSTDTAAKLVASDNHTVSMPGSTINYTNLQNDSVRGCVTWTPAATDTGTRVFVVAVKDSSCASGGIPITYAITVPLYVWAVTTALKDTTICAGESVPLNSVGGTGYVWSVVPGGSPITSLSCTSCKSPIATPSVTTSYIVTSNSAAVCNQNTDTLTVTVKQLPVASATGNSPICPGDTLKLFGNTTTGATYSWTGPNSFTSTLQNPVIPNAQTVNSGFYGYTLRKDGCNSEPYFIQMYVGPPAGPAASSNSPVCMGNQIILTATTVTGTTVTYHWSGPGGFSSTLQNPVKNNATYADSGKYFVYAMKDGCKTFTDSVNIKVNPLPAAPVATLDTVKYCQNVVSSPLTATGTNLKWYNVPTGGTGTGTLSPSTLTAGTFKYYVSQTDGNGCEGPRDSVVVVVTPKPSNPTVVSTLGYCQGATVPTLTATGTNLKWYTTPFGGSPLGFAPTPSSATPGNTTYYVSQTDNVTGCESDRAGITITIYATPGAPVVVSPVGYCVGGPVSPSLGSQVTGSNILWYMDPTGGTGSVTAPAVNTSTVFSDTFYVSQTVNGCESPRAAMIVNVVANPSRPVTANISYCQFATAVPLTATGTNLLWYTSVTGGTGSTIAPTPPTNTAGTFKYYVSQTVGGCESLRDSITVTINAKPQPPVGNDDSICQYSTPISLTATGTNLRWYDTAVGGIGTAIAPMPDTDTPGTYFWYVSQSVLGCESNRDTIEIEIVPQPLQPETDTVEYCFNATAVPLTALGQNLLWYNFAVGGTGSPVAPTPSTATIGYTKYYVSQTINGCESKRDTLTVKVDTFVSVRISFSDSSFCLYDSIEVTQTGLMPDTSLFTWGWDGGTVISGDSSGPYIIKWSTAGTKKVTLFADNKGCLATDTNTLEVLPLPQAYFNMIAEVCIGVDVNMVVDSVLKDVSTFVWGFDTVNTTIVKADSNKFTARWSTMGKKTVSLVTISDSGCISGIFYDTVNVRDYPKAKIIQVDNNTVCTKSEITLKTASLQGLHKYEWSPEEYFMTNKASEVIAKISSSGYLKVRVTDEYGCSGQDSMYVAVKLCCKAILPSAFSPNKDGNNDNFGIISNGNYRILAFRVVNRYGREVFSTNNQKDRWDGTYNGQPQDLGTYYYYIKYTCQDDDADNEVEERGDVVLIR